ncbi:MAG: hypothetical protein M0T84_06390 [Betaproteobacteria bacterium]|nr:hypothetical protein [Betaproteobacteria bacterium]
MSQRLRAVSFSAGVDLPVSLAVISRLVVRLGTTQPAPSVSGCRSPAAHARRAARRGQAAQHGLHGGCGVPAPCHGALGGDPQSDVAPGDVGRVRERSGA